MIGEDLRRFDWREAGVDLGEDGGRFTGVELEDALGKWDRRWGISKVFDYIRILRLDSSELSSVGQYDAPYSTDPEFAITRPTQVGT